MIEIDTRHMKQYESDLKTFAAKAYPFATRSTVDTAAFETRKEAQSNIASDMVLRNRFTQGSVRVQQARSLNVRDQEAVTGSAAEYLATQEFGGTVTGKGAHQPIATSYSAGLGENARPRTKLPRRPNQMQRIQLKRRGRSASSRKQRNVAAVREAAGSGNKYVFMDLGRRQGIFKVTGGKRKPRVKMVWDLSRRAVRVPRNPWLGPATTTVENRIPTIYTQAMAFQLKRRGLFRDYR